ncbi:MAG TPA: ATP-binding protein [Solirubrobacterales bacterium]|nr:ATP-binding protein [Solirubrobacterales bacterium]
MPQDAREIEQLVQSGSLEETSSFDGKEALPAPKRNIDLAIDVAAMSTDGGLLLYGVGEDEQERLSRLTPIELAGAADRISQIIGTSIAEVPYVEIREHPSDANPSEGYLTILVPQSARAPHQVIVGDDKRYYGRNAKGNRRLAEGEVARLYRRRLAWEQDRDALLVEAIQQARFPPHNDLGYLHGFVRPLAPDRAIWERAIQTAGGRRELQDALRKVAASTGPRRGYDPDLRGAANWRQQGADEWLFSTLPDTDAREEPDRADQAVDVRINVDGRGHLFCGRAGARTRSGEIAIFEDLIAGNFAAFLGVMGKVYDLGEYHGQVDLGVSVTGIRGGTSVSKSSDFGGFGPGPYRADSYPRTDQVAAAALLDPEAVTSRMLDPFFEATTGQDHYNPFQV